MTGPAPTGPDTTEAGLPRPAHDAARALDVLQRSPLGCLPGSSLHHLSEWATIREVEAGEAVAHEGDPAEAMYVVVSDDNPFDNANFGPISSYSISAEVPLRESFLLLAWFLLVLLFL